MSDTPRVDLLHTRTKETNCWHQLSEMDELARELERENAKLMGLLVLTRPFITSVVNGFNPHKVGADLLAQIDAQETTK